MDGQDEPLIINIGGKLTEEQAADLWKRLKAAVATRPGVVLPPRRNWVLVKGFHDSGAIDGVFGPYTKEHAEWLLNGMLDRTGFNWTLAEMQAAPG